MSSTPPPLPPPGGRKYVITSWLQWPYTVIESKPKHALGIREAYLLHLPYFGPVFYSLAKAKPIEALTASP